MTAALVRRPRRKRHLAGPRGADWWTVCDRVVSGPDVEATLVDDVDVEDLEARPEQLCVECRRMILFADVVERIGVGRLVASLELSA